MAQEPRWRELSIIFINNVVSVFYLALSIRAGLQPRTYLVTNKNPASTNKPGELPEVCGLKRSLP